MGEIVTEHGYRFKHKPCPLGATGGGAKRKKNIQIDR